MRMRFIQTIVERVGSRLPGKGRGQHGQALVLIALAMVALLAMAGLGVDLAIVLMRRADLQRAVDAAALAGVVELAEPGATTADADNVALELLAGNGIDVPPGIANVNPTGDCPADQSCMWSAAPTSEQPGIYRYEVRALMPVQLAFMNAIGISSTTVPAEATAEHFPQAEIFASTTLETGIIKSSAQAVWGPDGCTYNGDPYTPSQSPWWDELEGTYNYRLRIPRSFVENRDTLRLEIFDPDSYNQATNNPVTVTLEDSSTDNRNVSSSRHQPILIDMDFYYNSPQYVNNDFWFYRVEEIRNGDPNSNALGTCNNYSSYNPESNVGTQYETSVQFELFYYTTENDGSQIRQNLAQYTNPQSRINSAPTGHPNVDQHCTDLRWVSPGPVANQGSDYPSGACPQGVPVDGSAESDFAYTPDVGNGDFEIELPDINYTTRTCTGGELPNCTIDPLNDDLFVNLNVTGVAGASENVFEFWAGPDLSVYDIPTEVNERHLYILDPANGGPAAAHGSEGVVVAGLGHLPMNAVGTKAVDIPVMYVGPHQAGQEVQIRLFDPDAGSNGPLVFFFDTVPKADWTHTTCDNDTAGAPNCDQPAGQQHSPGQHIWEQNMQDSWINPAFEFIVPSESDDTPVSFVGGILNANYAADHMDSYGWWITIKSRPYLVE